MNEFHFVIYFSLSSMNLFFYHHMDLTPNEKYPFKY